MLADTDTISFLDLLEPPKTRDRELCKTWNNAVKNDCGVYVTNVFTFPAGSYKDYYLELNLALAFPYVLGEICYKTKCYGCGNPLDDDSNIKFSVYEDHEQLREYLIGTINQMMNADGNMEPKDFYRLSQLNRSVVDKAMECMKQ